VDSDEGFGEVLFINMSAAPIKVITRAVVFIGRFRIGSL
jgi:hypothetical protein